MGGCPDSLRNRPRSERGDVWGARCYEHPQEVAGVAWLRAPLIVASEGWLVGRRHAVDVFDDFRKKDEK